MPAMNDRLIHTCLVIVALLGCSRGSSSPGPVPTGAGSTAPAPGHAGTASGTGAPASAASPAPDAPASSTIAYKVEVEELRGEVEGCDKALQLGRSAARSGDKERAYQHLVRAVACDSGSAAARGELGLAALRLGGGAQAAAILREAEALADQAGDRATQRAIAHNLAEAYAKAGSPEAARHARLREARLGAGGDAGEGGSACPVTAEPSAVFSKGTWFDAQREVAPRFGKSEPQPQTAAEARRLSCWVHPSSNEEPQLSDACGGKPEWDLGRWLNAFTQSRTFLWPLSGDQVVWTTPISSGGTFCPGDAPSTSSGAQTRMVGDFIVLETSQGSHVPVLPRGSDGSAPCIAIGLNREIHVYDRALGRAAALVNLAADVRVELLPKEHSVVLRGRFCEDRVEIASVNRRGG